MGRGLDRDLPRDAFLLMGLTIGVMQGLGIVPTIDSLIYWRAHLDALYPAAWGVNPNEGYIYPPPLAQLLAPVHLVGFGIYQAVVTTGLFACLWYCAGRWSYLFVIAGLAYLAVPGLPYEVGAVFGYAMNGNVQLLIAACVVASFRHPGAWAVPLLTKPTFGVGLLWYVLRREWRSLAIALGVTAGVVAVSFLLGPNLWFEWVRWTIANAGNPGLVPLVPVPLPVRLAMSVALLIWAAPRNERWALPIAVGWSMPLLYVGAYLAIWVGAIRLRRGPYRHDPWGPVRRADAVLHEDALRAAGAAGSE